jgi:hypothetical protein
MCFSVSILPGCAIHFVVTAMRNFFFASLLVVSCARAAITPDAPVAGKVDAGGVEFFEKHIRPVLSQKCYGCHSTESGKTKGGLLLDTREGIRAGGDSGHAVVPGSVKDSLLIKALRYTDKEIAMPPKKEGGMMWSRSLSNGCRWARPTRARTLREKSWCARRGTWRKGGSFGPISRQKQWPCPP